MRTLRAVRNLRFLAALVILLVTASLSAAPSPIADAAQKGDLASVRALLAKKVDVNAPQNDGSTALHWAVYRSDVEMANLHDGAAGKLTINAADVFQQSAGTVGGKDVDLFVTGDHDGGTKDSVSLNGFSGAAIYNQYLIFETPALAASNAVWRTFL